MLIGHEPLTEIAAGLLRTQGIPSDSAGFVAETLVDADLRGHFSHGVHQLHSYLESLENGRVNANPSIKTVERTSTRVHINSDGGMGQLAARDAMLAAIDLARESGVGVATVSRSTHYGAGGYWVRIAVSAGMIGFTTSNDPGVTVAAHGSSESALGNLPYAWGVPAGREPDIVLDMGTGTVADGKVSLAALDGSPAGAGWGVDADGEPAIRAADIAALLPFGGAKGFGINLVSDVLGGILAGNEASSVLAKQSDRKDLWTSHFFLALDVAAFTDESEFRARVDRQIQAVRAARRAPGVERILIPGERAGESHRRQLKLGVELPAMVRIRLEELAEARGVSTPWRK